jgi:tetratricopeptide (TPR) repeat protein
LSTHRQALHAAIGQALETLYGDRLADVADRLAFHYARTREADKAVAYLTQVAEKAARSYAHVEAVTTLQEALGHAERLPAAVQDQCGVALVLRLAHSLYFLGRFAETLELLLRQQARLEHLQDPALTGPYFFWLSHTYSYLGQTALSTQYAQTAAVLAQQCGDRATQGQSSYVLARNSFWGSVCTQGLAYGHQAMALLEQTPEAWWYGQACVYVALLHHLHRDFAPALAAAAQIQTIGTASGDPRLQASEGWVTGMIYADLQEWPAAIAACEEALARSPDPVNAVVSLGILGHIYAEQGEAAAAIPLLEQAVQQVRQFRYRALEGRFTAFLGQAYGVQGDHEKARDAASQGLEMARSVQHWYGVIVAQRVLGHLAQTRGALVEAASHLQEALQRCTTLHLRYELARTHVDLATLAHTQGDHAAATTHLAEARAMFRALRIPKWAEATAQLAQAWGSPLTIERD